MNDSQPQQQHGNNGGPSGEELKSYLDAVAEADDELLTMRSEHMQRCKGPRGKIKETMTLAKEAGVNLKALRELIADDRAKRRRDRKIAELEADDLSDYEQMCEALGEFGDTPLGQAALRVVKGDKTLDNLTA